MQHRDIAFVDVWKNKNFALSLSVLALSMRFDTLILFFTAITATYAAAAFGVDAASSLVVKMSDEEAILYGLESREFHDLLEAWITKPEGPWPVLNTDGLTPEQIQVMEELFSDGFRERLRPTVVALSKKRTGLSVWQKYTAIFVMTSAVGFLISQSPFLANKALDVPFIRWISQRLLVSVARICLAVKDLF